MFDLLTQPETKLTKPFNPKDYLNNLPSVSPRVFEEYFWGKQFGIIQKRGMVWKYNNPWLYPANEFEMLKTIVTAELYAQAHLVSKPNKITMPEVSQATKQNNMLREKMWQQHLAGNK